MTFRSSAVMGPAGTCPTSIVVASLMGCLHDGLPARATIALYPDVFLVIVLNRKARRASHMRN
ncbi:hypothetical protein D9M68_499850 [compost metagenome]